MLYTLNFWKVITKGKPVLKDWFAFCYDKTQPSHVSEKYYSSLEYHLHTKEELPLQ